VNFGGFSPFFGGKGNENAGFLWAKATKNDTDSTRNGILRKKTGKVTGLHRISS